MSGEGVALTTPSLAEGAGQIMQRIDRIRQVYLTDPDVRYMVAYDTEGAPLGFSRAHYGMPTYHIKWTVPVQGRNTGDEEFLAILHLYGGLMCYFTWAEYKERYGGKNL